MVRECEMRKKKGQRDVRLLTLKLEEGAISQGPQEVLTRGEKQGHGF